MWAGAFALVILAVVAPVLQRRDHSAQQFDRWRDVTNAFFNYTNDWDDTCPLSMSYDTVANRWRYSSYHAVPAGSSPLGARHKEPRSSEETSVFSNTIAVYLTSPKSLVDDSLPFAGTIQGNDPPSVRAPMATNLTYNGLLHGLPLAEVVTPSRAPVLSQHYRQNTVGFAAALPALRCSHQGPDCRFNSLGYPQPGQTSCAGSVGYGSKWFLSTPLENFSVWVHDQGMVFVRADGSIELRKLTAPLWPDRHENVNENPWSSFDPAGVPGMPYWDTQCVEPGGNKETRPRVYYFGYFRPDNEFNYTLQQCDFGGG